MLLVAIPLIWLAVAMMVVVICRMAAIADDRAAEVSPALEHGEPRPVASRELSPSPYGRAAARQRWRAAHGLH